MQVMTWIYTSVSWRVQGSGFEGLTGIQAGSSYVHRQHPVFCRTRHSSLLSVKSRRLWKYGLGLTFVLDSESMHALFYLRFENRPKIKTIQEDMWWRSFGHFLFVTFWPGSYGRNVCVRQFHSVLMWWLRIAIYFTPEYQRKRRRREDQKEREGNRERLYFNLSAHCWTHIFAWDTQI